MITSKGIVIRIRRYTFGPGPHGKFVRVVPWLWPQWSSWFTPRAR